MPIGRHLADPLDPAVLHLGIRIEALRDCSSDDGFFVLAELLDDFAAFRDVGVDGRATLVEEFNDSALLGRGGNDDVCFLQLFLVHAEQFNVN